MDPPLVPTPFKCDLCDQKFENITKLSKHNRLSHKLDYKCDVCGVILTGKANYNDHMKENHPKRFSCDICGKKFTYNNQLETHIRARHKKLPKYQCLLPACNEQMVHRYQYLDHLRFHDLQDIQNVANLGEGSPKNLGPILTFIRNIASEQSFVNIEPVEEVFVEEPPHSD